jgi:hypothetical protein
VFASQRLSDDPKLGRRSRVSSAEIQSKPDVLARGIKWKQKDLWEQKDQPFSGRKQKTKPNRGSNPGPTDGNHACKSKSVVLPLHH